MSTHETARTLEQLHRIRPLARALDISPATIWRLRKRGDFPEPVRISPGAVGWRDSDIKRWVDSRPKPRT